MQQKNKINKKVPVNAVNIKVPVDDEKSEETIYPIVLSITLINKLLETKKFAELIGLYIFYYKTGRKQKTNQPWANNSYTATGLRWSVAKVKKYKKLLIELGLIENIFRRRNDGRFEKWYIKVNYIWTKNKIDKL